VTYAPIKSAATSTARKDALRAVTMAAREKTLWLLEQTPERLLKVRVHDFCSPIGWHFGHIGMTDEAWTLCNALRRPSVDSALSFLFANRPENPMADGGIVQNIRG
jgi:hypothetical protein